MKASEVKLRRWVKFPSGSNYYRGIINKIYPNCALVRVRVYISAPDKNKYIATYHEMEFHIDNLELIAEQKIMTPNDLSAYREF